MNKSNAYNRVVGLQLGLIKNSNKLETVKNIFQKLLPKSKEFAVHSGLGAIMGGGLGASLGQNKNIYDLLVNGSHQNDSLMDKAKYVMLGDNVLPYASKGAIGGAALLGLNSALAGILRK